MNTVMELELEERNDQRIENCADTCDYAYAFTRQMRVRIERECI